MDFECKLDRTKNIKEKQIKLNDKIIELNEELLHGCTNCGFDVASELLLSCLKRGADVHYLDDEALMLACKYGKIANVELLLEYGADVMAKNGQALEIAKQFGHFSILNMLKVKMKLPPAGVERYTPHIGNAYDAALWIELTKEDDIEEPFLPFFTERELATIHSTSKNNDVILLKCSIIKNINDIMKTL